MFYEKFSGPMIKGAVCMLNNKLRNRNGSALAMVLIIFLALSVLGVAALRLSVSEINNTVRSETKLKSYYLARSGAHAVAEFMIDNPYKEANPELDAMHFINNSGMGWSETSNWNVGETTGTISFKIEDLANNDKLLYAKGNVGGIEQIVKVVLQIAEPGPNPLFDHAIIGDVSVTMANAAGTAVNVLGSVASPNEDGLDGLYHEKTGDLLLESVDEMVFDPNILFLDIVVPESFIHYNTNELDLKSTRTLNSGNYVVEKIEDKFGIPTDEAIHLQTRNAKVIIPADSVVYLFVKGGINVEAGGMFEVGDRAKLYIYVDSDEEVVFSGSISQTSSTMIYAPYSSVTYNNAGPNMYFRGTIIGENLILQNGLTFEYDSDLFKDGGQNLGLSNSGTDVEGFYFTD